MPDYFVEETRNIVVVIEPEYKSSDFNCPVCKLIIRGLEDVESIDNYACCTDCQDFFYWPNREKWLKGWRPKKEEVQNKLNNYYSTLGENNG